VAAIEAGWFQREIADFAYGEALRRASGERVVVGVNRYVDPPEEEEPIQTHRLDPETEARQVEHLRRVRAARDGARVDELLARLRATALDEAANLMPATIAAVEARVTMGEVVGALEEVFGRYRESAVF
jgi:methylmalonyl-CoA mutase N-terminal domain/subunit